MTLKLTHSQAEALKHLFDNLIIPEKPENVADSLLKDLIMQVYRKLRHKLECKIKDGYSLTLNDVEGKAFYLFFQQVHLGVTWQYEQTVIENLLIPLDKAYA